MHDFHYEAQNYDRLLGTPGFSDELLKNHFSLYQGYVANTNKLIDNIERLLQEGKSETPEFAELHRRFGWEWNGIRLHELYFGNMTKEKHPYDENSKIAEKISKDYHSFSAWEKDFRSVGSMRGIGWVVLYYDITRDRLWNVWIHEHDQGHLTGAVPLLIMDVFEHAFMLDYGIKKAGYLEAFLNAACWRTIERRFEKALSEKKQYQEKAA